MPTGQPDEVFQLFGQTFMIVSIRLLGLQFSPIFLTAFQRGQKQKLRLNN
jgi:hypothetical protein